jgi:transposase-like protein
MAVGLHGSARTTPRVRAELQTSQAPTRTLAARYGLNPKTVAKWRKRTTTTDAPMRPARPRSTTLTEAEEAIVVEFRPAPSCRSTMSSAACAKPSPD